MVLGAATFMFFVLRLSGDPVSILVPPQADEQTRAELAQRLGLDRPLPVQFAIYAANLLRGDLGTSFASGEPALGLALERLPYTVLLASLTLVFVIVTAIPLGILAARRAGSWVDRAVMVFCTMGQSIPSFATATFLIILFSVTLRWLPAAGAREPASLVLPVLTLGLYSLGRTARLVRAGMVAALREDYIRTARAKGVGHAGLLLVHAFPNVLIPVVTMLGLEAGGLFGRAVIVEVVFAWPGIGRLIVDSVLARDYAIAQAGVIVLAAVYSVINTSVDLLYPLIDPRLRPA